jgi:TPR repeat protein
MARSSFLDVESNAMGGGRPDPDSFYKLGMMYSVGDEGPADMVSAHKWLNIAAKLGHADAPRLRQEIAGEMSAAEIAAAQRAARDWMTRH